MIGREATAPCGHVGECVIGTYVQCLVGCDTNGRVIGPRRGEPGHVHMCACTRCRVRRKVTNIIIRSSEGKDVVNVQWDGISEIKGAMDKPWDARHWFMYDDNGDVVTSGGIYADLAAGPYELHPMRLPGMAFEITTSQQLTNGLTSRPESHYTKLKSRVFVPPKGSTDAIWDALAKIRHL